MQLQCYLLHCVLREPFILQQLIENRLAHLGLLRCGSSPELVKAYVEPLINLPMNRMVPTKITEKLQVNQTQLSSYT